MISKVKFRFRSLVNRSSEEVFGWHLRKQTFERYVSPCDKTTIVFSGGRPNHIGSKIVVRVKIFRIFSTTLTLKYTDYVSNESFQMVGEGEGGILKEIRYETRITPQNNYHSEIVDSFTFSYRFPRILNGLVNRIIKKRISRLLAYKHDLIDHDIEMIRKYPFKKPFKVLITGSHGLIGKSLSNFLEFIGHDVWHLSRIGSNRKKTILWDPKTGDCDLHSFEGFDVVIHLAGENIGNGWWTKKKKEKILKSRSRGTDRLVDIIKKLKQPPQAFICASGIGYYGNRGNQIVDEDSSPGKELFISKVCKQWEESSKTLEKEGIRVIHTRFGLVLSAAGGFLKKILLPFKFGIAGKFGKGRQYVSWIAIDDVIGAIYHVMMTSSLQGPINIVAPNPVPNDVLTKKLSERVNRWKGPPFPEFMIHFLFGQKGKELFLTSTRVKPRRLSESGYLFHYPRLSKALEHIL